MRGITSLLVVMGVGVGTVRAEVPVREETVEVVDPGAKRKRAALYLAAGGGALVASSLVVAFVARNHYGKCAADGALLEPRPYCPYPDDDVAANNYANDQQDMARTVGTPLFVAGLLAIGTAVVLRATAPAKRRVVRVSVTPSVSPDSAGIVLGARF